MISDGLVCLIGVSTVFIGLICLVAICYALSVVCKAFIKDTPKNSVINAPVQTANNAQVENKQEIIAGVCAVIAEELGTDVNNIKVTSFKRV